LGARSGVTPMNGRTGEPIRGGEGDGNLFGGGRPPTKGKKSDRKTDTKTKVNPVDAAHHLIGGKKGMWACGHEEKNRGKRDVLLYWLTQDEQPNKI